MTAAPDLRTVFRDQSYGDVAREPQWEYHGKVRPATLADFAAFGLAAPGGG